MDTMKAENWWVRQSFEKICDPHYKEMVITNQAWKMTETPPRVKWACRPVGADNDYIYNRKLGWGKVQIQTMKDQGVI